jgi:hypothetical protein
MTPGKGYPVTPLQLFSVLVLVHRSTTHKTLAVIKLQASKAGSLVTFGFQTTFAAKL